MDYKKEYKEALERMKSWVRGEHPECFTEAQKAAEFIFPELKESEDEKVRKELIIHCRNTRCVTEEGAERIAKWIAWLKKQGERKPAWSEEDERICQCLIEDQEESLDKVSNDKYGHSEIISDLKEMYGERIDWLKTLKERIGWKPSEEQMEALTLAIHDVHEMWYKKHLLSLKQQLKQV